MKKIALGLTALMAVLVMAGCEVPVEAEDNSPKVKDYINLVIVCSNGLERVCYDSNTGVMYYKYSVNRSNCGMTPIYNSDGSLKIYEGWEKEEDKDDF